LPAGNGFVYTNVSNPPLPLKRKWGILLLVIVGKKGERQTVKGSNFLLQVGDISIFFTDTNSGICKIVAGRGLPPPVTALTCKAEMKAAAKLRIVYGAKPEDRAIVQDRENENIDD
jgi:hypothetical protein